MTVFASLDGVPVYRSADLVSVPWWSFTKPVLAAAALSLVRDGLVRLDEPLPGAPHTLRQLLRHEAGLADYGDLDAYHQAVAGGEPPWSADEMVRRLDATRPSDHPGTRWRYSNVGYMHVASLLSKTTGLDLEDALRDRVLAPLGMNRTSLARTRSDLQHVDMGQARGYDPGWVFHGLLVGPLGDAVHFLTCLFSGQLLPDSLVTEMTSARTLGGPIVGRPWTSAAYGLGLMQGEWQRGMFVHGHTGSGPGSTIAVYHHRHRDRSVCAAVFRDDDDAGRTEAALQQTLLDVLAGASHRDAPLRSTGQG